MDFCISLFPFSFPFPLDDILEAVGSQLEDWIGRQDGNKVKMAF